MKRRDTFVLRLIDQRQLEAVLRSRDAEMAAKLAALKGRHDALELSAFEVLETQTGSKGFRFKKSP